VFRLLQKSVGEKTGKAISSNDLRDGIYRSITEQLTITTATAGNHGKSVAWGASLFHCQCVVFIPHTCSQNREAAISKYGARIERTAFSYDDTVRQCAEQAKANKWTIVSDTSWTGYER